MAAQILIVDDFLPWLRFVQGMFESKTDLNIVATAINGIEAVQKAKQFRPDVILMDVGLPGVNGLEATRQIRLLSPNSKILFLSEESSPDIVEEALRLGAQGYLLKSDAVSELLLAVDAVLQGKQFFSGGLKPYVISNVSDAHPGHRLRSKQPQEGHISRVHEVASYRQDSSLVNGFSHFVEAALKVGNPAIVIATEVHRTGILYQLQASGLDIAAAIQERKFISLDVADVLSTFMVNDWPDPARFSKAVGDLIIEAADAVKGKPPRIAACGECAPILWAQGKAEAAVQLERLWDAIARSYEVNVLCGYLLPGMRSSENNLIFERICAEHSVAYSV